MKIFGKKLPFSREKKSIKRGTEFEVPVEGALGKLLGTSQGVSISDAFYYYRECQPVGTVIDIIVNALIDLPLLLEIDGVVQSEHEILDLLSHPSPDYTGRLFMKAVTIDYLLTGEAFVYAAGTETRPPVMLAPINPSNVFVSQGDDGYAVTYEITGLMHGGRYIRQDKDNYACFKNDTNGQLKQIRGFSTKDNSQLRGESVLYSVVRDIQQNLAGAKHNLRLLVRGGRLSAVFSIKEDCSPEKFMETKNEIISQFAGGQGGASIAVVNGNQIEVSELGKSNKDMDFANLHQMTEKSIAKRYNVPLQLISDQSSSYNNLSTAHEALYNNCIVPLANEILDGFSDLLFPRYNLNPSNVRLLVDTSKIPAIAERQAVISDKRRTSYIWTDNELRADQGLPPVDNGNSIYRPSTWINDEQLEQQEARLTEEAEAMQNDVDTNVKEASAKE